MALNGIAALREIDELISDREKQKLGINPAEKYALDVVRRDAIHAIINQIDTRLYSEYDRLKLVELEYMYQVRGVRQVMPSAIFREGYAGYGNSWTGSTIRLLYPQDRKRGDRMSREPLLPIDKVRETANLSEQLVPLRINLATDKYRLKDRLLWNADDTTIPLELFVEITLEDYGLPLSLAPDVSRSLQEQISNHLPHIYPISPEEREKAEKENELRNASNPDYKEPSIEVPQDVHEKVDDDTKMDGEYTKMDVEDTKMGVEDTKMDVEDLQTDADPKVEATQDRSAVSTGEGVDATASAGFTPDAYAATSETVLHSAPPTHAGNPSSATGNVPGASTTSAIDPSASNAGATNAGTADASRDTGTADAGPSTASPSTTGPSTASPSTTGPSTASPSTTGPSTASPTSPITSPSSAAPRSASPEDPSTTGPSIPASGAVAEGPGIAGPSNSVSSAIDSRVDGPGVGGPNGPGLSSVAPGSFIAPDMASQIGIKPAVEDAPYDEDMRFTIKLDITIGQHQLVDQFEWDINNPDNDPEMFGLVLANELALPLEFSTAIAHAIREQIQTYSKALFNSGYQFDGKLPRDVQLQNELAMPVNENQFLRRPELLPLYTPALNEAKISGLDSSQHEQDVERREIRSRRRMGRSSRRGNHENRAGASNTGNSDVVFLPQESKGPDFCTPLFSSALPGGLDRNLSILYMTVYQNDDGYGGDKQDLVYHFHKHRRERNIPSVSQFERSLVVPEKPRWVVKLKLPRK